MSFRAGLPKLSSMFSSMGSETPLDKFLKIDCKSGRIDIRQARFFFNHLLFMSPPPSISWFSMLITGCALIYDEFSIVVVEGGGKSIKRYGKLMLRRINWSAKLPTEDDDEEEDEGEEKDANKCVLVWQGSVAKPSFYGFFKKECRTEAAARKFLADVGVGHYYDLAANFTDEDQA